MWMNRAKFLSNVQINEQRRAPCPKVGGRAATYLIGPNMAKFLTTSAANYYLEELIKKAQKHLVLISPYLKVNDRMRELLEDKNREQLAIRVIYGKKHQSQEIAWLKDLSSVKVGFSPRWSA